MAKEQAGAQEEPGAAALEEPGVIAPEGVPLEGTPAAGENQEVEGLKAAAKAEREKRQTAETELQNVRDQNALLSQQQVTQTKPQEQVSLSQAVAKQLGIDLELATPEEICQINEGVLQITSGQQAEQSFINSHPDYAEVVGVNGPRGQFQYAPPLLRALNGNPALQSALQNSPNKAVLAYSIASKDPQYLKEQVEAAKSEETKAAEKAVTKIEAANQQLSVSAAKGGGNLDQAAAIKAMSDEEFRKHNEEIMAKAT